MKWLWIWMGWSLLAGLGLQPVTAGDSFVFGSMKTPLMLDPAAVIHMEHYKVIELMLNGLVKYDPNGSEILPDLAISWRVSEDKRSWIFKLRRGVRFHDGSVFDAEAVVVNFSRQIDPKHPLYSPKYTYGRLVYANVLEVRAQAADEVVFLLDRPFAPFLAALATSCGKMVSPKSLYEDLQACAQKPIGTGAFQMVSSTAQRIEFKRNPYYFDGPPQLETLTIKQFDNPREILLELKLGQVHATDFIPPNLVAEVVKTEGLMLSSRPGFNVVYLGMNTRRGPLVNPMVRRAVNHAVNKKNLVKLVYQGFANPASSPLPPKLWGHHAAQPPYDYNPQKARDILAEAGFADGFEISLWVVHSSWYPAGIEKMIKANLEAVGIRTRLQINDVATHVEGVEAGAHDICLYGWSGDTLDPDSFLWHLFASESGDMDKPLNYSYLRNPELDNLLLKARKLFERDARSAVYRQAQQMIHHLAPWVPLAHLQLNLAHSEKVTGVVQYPNGLLNFDKAKLQ